MFSMMLDRKEIDETDIDILKILSKDGRKSFRKIAKELNKSPVTITKHVDELIEDGIIKLYTTELNYERLGYDIIAFIELTIDKGKMLQVERDIAIHPNIFAVYDVTGTYDAMLLARFKTRRELDALVKKINSFEYVLRTNTHLILNVMKEHTNFGKLMQVDTLKQEAELLINEAHKEYQDFLKQLKDDEKLKEPDKLQKQLQIQEEIYTRTHKNVGDKLQKASDLDAVIIEPLISLMQEILADVLDIRKKDRL